MNKKYVEEFNITSPGFVVVENLLNMRYDDDSIKVVIKKPNSTLMVRSFYDHEEAGDFINKFAKQNFNNFNFDKSVKVMPMMDLNTEYRVVDKEKCVSFGVIKEDKLPYTNIITDGITNYYSTSIKFNPNDLNILGRK